jgi:hypothetical protein
MIRLLAALLLLGLMGCATTEKYEALLQTWIGSEEIDLVRSWGPPDQVYEVQDRKFIVYHSQRSVYIPGTSPSYSTSFIGNQAYTTQSGGSPGRTVDMRCATTFELKDGIIVRWSWKGNDCTSTWRPS